MERIGWIYAVLLLQVRYECDQQMTNNSFTFSSKRLIRYFVGPSGTPYAHGLFSFDM